MTGQRLPAGEPFREGPGPHPQQARQRESNPVAGLQGVVPGWEPGASQGEHQAGQDRHPQGQQPEVSQLQPSGGGLRPLLQQSEGGEDQRLGAGLH